MRMRLTLAVPLALLVLAAPACGGTDEAADRGACPAAPLDVVVSVAPWSDLVTTLAGDCAEVTTVVRGDVDPHEFEPTPADSAAFEEADLIVVNGLDYDHWAEAAIEAGDGATVVDAGAVAGLEEGDNPHVWYDPEVVTEMTDAVGEALAAKLPGARDYLATRRTVWDEATAAYRATFERLAGSSATYVATESVFDPLATRLGLDDRTPEGFRRAAANETDPSPGDIADLEAVVRDGVDVMVVNTQTANPTTDRLRELAEEEGVPVIEVTETPPGRTTFGEWQAAQLDALAAAIGT